MELVKPSYKIEFAMSKEDAYKLIEVHGRKAYQSQDKIGWGTAVEFIKMLLGRKHKSVIEHSMVSVSMIMDRGVSHELVRHRLASYTQESSRFCSYKGHVKFIMPWWMDGVPEGIITDPNICDDYEIVDWLETMLFLEKKYHAALARGKTPQRARSVLPTSLKTEIGITANFRTWKHIQKMRLPKGVHPDMVKVMKPLFEDLAERYPEIFA